MAVGDADVTIVLDRASPNVAAAATHLRPLVATIAAIDVLHEPPRSGVYLFSLDASRARELAKRIADWAVCRTTGIIGVVENGTDRDREELLAAGFDDAVSGVASVRELALRVRAVHRRIKAT